MVSPAIDREDEPFSYASRSTDQISVMHSPSGTEITPEGYLYSGFGELMFFVGIDRAPVSQRVRTLEDGYLPIVSYKVDHDGLTYTFTMFAASLGDEQDGEQDGGQVVNFVRVSVHNPSSEAKNGFLTTAWRYTGDQTTTFSTGDNRFRRPAQGKRMGDYQQPGESFRADWKYAVAGDSFTRDGKAIYYFPAAANPQLTPSYRDYYNRVTTPTAEAPESERAPVVLPTTPLATAEFLVAVPAGGEKTLDFKMPLIPVEAVSTEARAVVQATFDDRRAQVRTFWNGLLERGIDIETPEKKVNDTFKTSLINDLMALNKVDGNYVQTINQLQYHGFYLRDSADFVRMYDTSGYTDIGGQVLSFFAARQQPDGNFLSQPGQYDGWGEALWTYGEHYRITHDRAFAAEVYPRVVRAVDWLEKALANEPTHLMPATDVRDNEYTSGHLTGYNFLALDGLDAAILLAHDLGASTDEQRFRGIRDGLRASFLKRLDEVTTATGGYIPPALDGNNSGSPAGTDWGNLLSLVPEQQLKPDDPRVTATLRATQAKYEEGLITYRQPDQGVYLHHYLTIKNTLTELIRGEQQQAIQEFYAELLHTSSTHAGFEYSVRPWGDRDFSGNLAPHGWFAAEYRNLLRNMMVREEGNTLHLFSALSPNWIGAGKSIRVRRANTYFGEVDAELTMPTEHEAVLSLDPHFLAGANPAVLLHLPWFMQVESVTADGKALANNAGVVTLPAGSQTVRIVWNRKQLSADVVTSYLDAVERYKQEYRRKFASRTGSDGR
jgi:hypothetical protein